MMTGSPCTRSIVAGAVLTLILASPVSAQGNGKGKGNNNRGGAGKSTPPNSSVLPPSTVAPASGGGATGAAPLAWIDGDAKLNHRDRRDRCDSQMDSCAPTRRALPARGYPKSLCGLCVLCG